MKHFSAGRSLISVLLLGVVFVSACHKQVATAPARQAPNPPAPPAPTITLNASASAIAQGGSSTLTWSSSNASQVRLYPEIGVVPAQGVRTVSPTESTVYTATATSPNGEATATASIRVSPARSPASSSPSPSLEQLFQKDVVDVYFDYDKADLSADARDELTRDGAFLRSHPGIRFRIEGHCDERGGEEYNLALGVRRATSAKQFLISLGLAADQIQTISLGKERPFCAEANESCYHQNRRAHFVMTP